MAISDWLCVTWGHIDEGFHTDEIAVSFQVSGGNVFARC